LNSRCRFRLRKHLNRKYSVSPVPSFAASIASMVLLRQACVRREAASVTVCGRYQLQPQTNACRDGNFPQLISTTCAANSTSGADRNPGALDFLKKCGSRRPLAGRHGVSSVARTLRLDYYKLRRRSKHRAPSTLRALGFVELPSPALPLLSGSGCTVELSDERGGKMTVHLPDQGPALLTMAQAFWQRQR
jgi:hypothetical protein